MSDSLLDDILAIPVAPAIPKSTRADFSRKLEVKLDGTTEATVNCAAAPREELEGKARELLEEYGLKPDAFAVTAFRVSKWTMANGEEGVSARFSFHSRMFGGETVDVLDLNELFDLIELHRASPVVVRPSGEHAFIVALGDMQFGKIDGDGPEGTLRRVIECINRAADALAWYRKRFDIGHIHVAWLGDHVEGFVSQGGDNAWRTQLTLSEQTRLVRRVMMHALQVFAPLAERVTMVAVPGNHGEPQRFGKKGITRYDDSHDTEALIAVSEAAALDPLHYGHVEFYTPEPDEMTVTLDLAGTVTSHAHGHQFRPGQHFKWWGDQTFGGSPIGQATLLLLGHLHHLHVEESGLRTMVQVPALEATSKWWEHATGVRGNPGIVVAVTKDGHTGQIEVVR